MTSMALTLGLRAAARAKQVQWMTRQWGTVLGCRVRPGHGDWPWLAHRGSSCIYVYVPYMIVGCLHKKQRKLYQIYCVSVLVSIPALLDVSLRQKFYFPRFGVKVHHAKAPVASNHATCASQGGGARAQSPPSSAAGCSRR